MMSSRIRMPFDPASVSPPPPRPRHRHGSNMLSASLSSSPGSINSNSDDDGRRRRHRHRRDDDDLPSKIMTTAQYLRIHANATPAKLRGIVRDLIFPHDDAAYLKRLVRDVGGMDYVFRHLWYDGPAPPPSANDDGGGGGRGGGSTGGRGGGDSGVVFGRTWIEYCCHRDAHECLRWILEEIVRNHASKTREARRRRWKDGLRADYPSQGADDDDDGDRSTTMMDVDGISFESEERDESRNDVVRDRNENTVGIVRQLLEYHSLSYCGTHYVAMATLCDSHRCLSLLLEHGGLDPNMAVNDHGSTAAHLAAWKDHVKCLRVLRSSGMGARRRGDDDDDEEDVDDLRGSSPRSSLTGGSDEFVRGSGREASFPPPPRASSSSRRRKEKERSPAAFAADWTRANALGETPLHVAAREGSTESIQFFLDLAIASATREMEEETDREEDDEEKHVPCIVDFSMRNNDGMDAASVAAEHDRAGVIDQMSDAIERLLDASMHGDDGRIIERSPPSCPRLLSSLPSPVRSAPPQDFWQSTMAYFQPQADPEPPPMMQAAKLLPPPQTPVGWNRRRTQSEPHLLSPERSSPARKPPVHTYFSRHCRRCLPHYFPTLNLRNSLELHDHETPVHVAARLGNCAVLEALFRSGNCDVAARDSLGRTALHVAASAGRVDACRTISRLAAREGRFEEDFDVVDVLGTTPLYVACAAGNAALARVLLEEAGSDWRVLCHERRRATDGSPLYVDVANTRRPPLHAAVAGDHVNAVSELLECGVDVNQTDAEGRTAISAAAKLGYHDLCQMLILHGANVNTRSSRGGPTPFQKAKKYKHQDVADLLHEFGGK